MSVDVVEMAIGTIGPLENPDREMGARVILFGGGDGGGLFFGLHGVRPIPAFDPALRKQLQAMNLLTHALQLRGRHAPTELSTLIDELAEVLVAQVEAVVGPLAEHCGLTYQDDHGGFTCSSIAPPSPFPWPPVGGRAIEVSLGVFEREVASVLRTGKLGLAELIAHPEKASTVGVELSERTRSQLRALAPSQIARIPDPEGREVAWFFHRVLADGRHLETWSIRPHEVATSLGVTLSDAALDRIIAGGKAVLEPIDDTDEVASAAIGVAAAVGVVIAISSRTDRTSLDGGTVTGPPPPARRWRVGVPASM